MTRDEKFELRLELVESGCCDSTEHIRLIELANRKGYSEAKRRQLFATHEARSH